MDTKKRIAWIDVAKGICMLSVIAGHLGVAEINNIVFAFHITVFFLLNGYTLTQVIPDQKYINKKFKSLMIPYFITCFCVMVMDIFNSIWWNNNASIHSISGIISTDLIRSFMASGTITTLGTMEIGTKIGAIWFLPALFFAILFTQMIMKYTPSRIKRFAVSFALMIFAYISAKFIWLPFSIQSAMFSVPFIMAGYELKQSNLLYKLDWKKCIGCFVIFLLCIGLNKTKINFVTASMDDVIISLISGASSSLIILFISMKLEKCKPLAWIGRHSLIYLCVHLFEINTMGQWFKLFLEAMSIPYTEFSRFCLKVIFISAVTAVILLMQKKIHFQTAVDKGSKKGLWSNAINEEKDFNIDISKGILVIILLIGYFSVEQNLRSIIYSFHLMAFVFFSGYNSKFKNVTNLPNSILGLAKSYLIPYAIFAVFAVFVFDISNIKTVFSGISYTKNLFTNIPSVGPVYFILVLFLVELIYLFVEKYCSNEYWKTGICFAISLVGFWLGIKGYWLSWSLDCAMFSAIFYHLGHCFKKYNLLNWFKTNPITYFILSIIWAYMIFNNGMELAIRNYGSYGLTVCGAICATILLYMLACYLNEKLPYWISELIQIIGKSFIYILIVHTLLNAKIQNFIELLFEKENIYYLIVSIAIQILIGILIYVLIQTIKTILTKKIQIIHKRWDIERYFYYLKNSVNSTLSYMHSDGYFRG